MSNPVEIVAILTPKPGRIKDVGFTTHQFNSVIEALAPFNKYIEDNEQGVLRYESYRQVNVESGVECLVYIEVYKDMEALELHRASGPYVALREQAAKEQLLARSPDIKILKRVGGFASRDDK